MKDKIKKGIKKDLILICGSVMLGMVSHFMFSFFEMTLYELFSAMICVMCYIWFDLWIEIQKVNKK